jgi:hypothetical protein
MLHQTRKIPSPRKNRYLTMVRIVFFIMAYKLRSYGENADLRDREK